MKPTLRGGLGWIATVCVSVLTTVVAMVIALPGGPTLGGAIEATLGRVPGLLAIGPLAPFRQDALAELLGRRAAARLLGTQPTATPQGPGVGSGSRPPSPPTTPPSEGESSTEQRVFGRPDLNVQMQVDRREAAQGDILRYVITITNRGEGSQRTLRLRSHIPEGTTWVQDEACRMGPVAGPVAIVPGQEPGDPDAITLCIDPRESSGTTHRFSKSIVSMPGRSTQVFAFSVAIGAVENGTTIVNHAHIDWPPPDPGGKDTDEVSTRVSR